MGLFGDLDVESAEIVSDLYDAGVWPFIVSNVELKPTAGGDKMGLIRTCTFTDGKYSGRKFFTWDRVPVEGFDSDLTPEKRQNALNYLKTRMINIGVPADQINNVNPEDMIGREGVVRVIKGQKTTRQADGTKVATGEEQNTYYFNKPAPVGRAASGIFD